MTGVQTCALPISGIGLYQLVLSVSVLFATFAISGIRFAATRLISEEMGLERGAGVTGAMRRCACYALFFGLCAGRRAGPL